MKYVNFLLAFFYFVIPLVKGQEYDVGVYYMPFWDQKYTSPTPQELDCDVTVLSVSGEQVEKYTNCNGGVPGNWNIIYKYNEFLATKYAWDDIRVPDNLYWPSSQWYNERWKHVVEKQHQLMAQNGVDFVIYDSFFTWDTDCCDGWVPYWNHALQNTIKPGFNNHGVRFGIMWALEFLKLVVPNRCDDFLRGGGLDSLVKEWRPYFEHPNYKKITVGGIEMPVFYILVYTKPDTEHVPGTYPNSLEGLCGYCKYDSFFPTNIRGWESENGSYVNNKKTKYFLEQFEAKLGFPLYKVAVVSTQPEPDYTETLDWNNKWTWLIAHPEKAGFQATTTYGYKYFDRHDLNTAIAWDKDKYCGDHPNDYTYTTMRNIYEEYYDYILTNSSLDYQVPVTAGWNRSSLNRHQKLRGENLENLYDANPENLYKADAVDCAISDPTSFNTALNTAKTKANQYVSKTDRRIMICCWNEYAEGTVIEPTTTFGSQYLQKINNLFPNARTGDFSYLPNVEQRGIDLEIFPNPFSESATLKLYLDHQEQVNIEIFNSTGQLLDYLINDVLSAGVHELCWDPDHTQKGIFYVSIQAGDYRGIEKIIIN